jgi:hypothetical protein
MQLSNEKKSLTFAALSDMTHYRRSRANTTPSVQVNNTNGQPKRYHRFSGPRGRGGADKDAGGEAHPQVKLTRYRDLDALAGEVERVLMATEAEARRLGLLP